MPEPPLHSPNPMSLRHRGLTRVTTTTEEPPLSGQNQQRRNSTFSDSVSEARNTIRSSTDDLFFPRAAPRAGSDFRDDESHWHSAPLGLALLPAIAGIFFTNGSAVVTDVMLLGLAAVFLNWSVRLPWDWYHSAQTVRNSHKFYDNLEPPAVSEGNGSLSPQSSRENQAALEPTEERQAISRELLLHELAALASCFIFPVIGTWILHTIRDKLSRPSEGLVSNYNLTIFLLAAEIRPFSHLLKMVQARTLYLQRIVASSDDDDKERIDVNKINDLSKRLEELEAHVAEAAAARLSPNLQGPGESSIQEQQDATQSLVLQATAEFRKGFQQDIDALNRAVRRYEKRTAISTYQTESRLHALETNIRDAISLAAAVQRSNDQRSRGIFTLLVEWTYAIVLLPIQIVISLANLPIRITKRCLQICTDNSLVNPIPSKPNKGKSPQPGNSQAPHRKRSKRISTLQEE